MSFGAILNQLMNSGLGGGHPQDRVGTAARNLGAGGSPVDGILGQIQGALGGAGGAGGGFADKARDFMTKDQVGGLSGTQLGGIGALAGALLGGGVGGAARGGALAVLGTLAVTALRNAKANAAGQPAQTGGMLTIEPEEVAEVAGPGAAQLMVRAMISAAKADGNIDQTEMQTIIGKVGEEGVTAEEKAFVMSELAAPVDIAALAGAVQGEAQAAEVYSASLVAIDVDTEAERQYLRDLAAALNLDAATVQQLHQMTGAPAA
jgi:uncharacterized membrane protein YebE (DUF533 family)